MSHFMAQMRHRVVIGTGMSVCRGFGSALTREGERVCVADRRILRGLLSHFVGVDEDRLLEAELKTTGRAVLGEVVRGPAGAGHVAPEGPIAWAARFLAVDP